LNIILHTFTSVGGWLEDHSVGITALATAVIAIFTATLWRATTETLSYSRQVERAYVSGNVIIEHDDSVSAVHQELAHKVGYRTPGRPVRLRFTLDNNGKTTAFVDEMAIVVRPLDVLPPRADYTGSQRLVDINLSPSASGVLTNFSFDFAQIAGKAVYGRVYYRDIYKVRHSSGFIRHVLSSTTDVIPADPSYTEWD
jgi:hypothetical protein